MVRIHWRIHAESDHVTARIGILAKHVINLIACKVAVAGADIADPVGIDQRQEGRVGRIAQRTPLIKPRQTAGGVCDSAAVVTNGPEVQPPLSRSLVGAVAGELREQHGDAVGLVIPVVRPPQRKASNVLAVDGLRLRQIRRLAGGAVQPRCAPRKLVVIARPRVVVNGGVGDGFGVLAAVGVRKVEQRAGVCQQGVRVRGVSTAEQHACRCHGCRGFTGQIGAGLGCGDGVRRPRHVHGFTRTPIAVVQRTISDLSVQHVCRRMCLDDEVGSPANRRKQCELLTSLLIRRAIFNATPRKQRERACHR